MEYRHPFAAMIPLPERWLRVITWAAFALPFVVYWWHILRYAPNTPFQDDFDIALGTVDRFLAADGIGAKLGTIWERTNDHRLVMVKLVALAQYGLLGHVDFRQLIVLSSAGWTAAFVVLMGRTKILGLGLPWLVPLPYIWFSFAQERIMFFGVGSQLHHWGVCLALLMLSLLVQRRTRWATASATLAAFTAGAGGLLAPVGIAFLASRRWWKGLLVFGPVACASALLAHVSYSEVLYHPSPRDALASVEATMVFFFRSFGSLVHAHDIEVPLGILCAGGLLFYVARRAGSPFFRLAAIFIFVLMTALAMARATFGEIPIASRYSIISLLAWSLLYVFVINGEREKPHGARTLLVAWVVAGVYFGGLVLKENVNQTFARNYTARVACLAALVPGRTTAGLSEIQPGPAYAEEVLVRARDTGVFDYRTANRLQSVDPVRIETLQASREYRGYIDGYDGQHIVGWAAIVGVRSSDARIFALLESGGQVYRIPSFPVRRADVSQAMGTQFGYDWAGFEAFFAAYEITAGSYRVGVYVESPAGSAMKWTELRYERARS